MDTFSSDPRVLSNEALELPWLSFGNQCVQGREGKSSDFSALEKCALALCSSWSLSLQTEAKTTR